MSMNEVVASDKPPFEGTGGYNDAPPGWREVTEEGFAKSLFDTYDPAMIENRQFVLPEDEGHDGATYQSVKLFWYYDGTGVAIVTNFWGGQRYRKDDGWEKGQHVRFFLFGCEHEYRELGADECRERGIRHEGMCWHVSLCEKCGHVESRDSSD
jgi:hypothetical protein